MMQTAQVRIAVAVGPDGRWSATGGSHADPDQSMYFAEQMVQPGEARYWLTATLPVPEAQTVEADAEPKE